MLVSKSSNSNGKVDQILCNYIDVNLKPLLHIQVSMVRFDYKFNPSARSNAPKGYIVPGAKLFIGRA